MINLDMVGRMRDNRVSAFGLGSSPQFVDLVAPAAEHLALTLNRPAGIGPSDHASFYNRSVPVLHFVTGTHADYHRPSDTWDKLNYPGMVKIGDLTFEVAAALAAQPVAPSFMSLPNRPPSAGAGPGVGPGIGVYLGVIPEYDSVVDGLRLAGVAPGSPAAAAGLQEGDVIVEVGGKKVSNIEDLTDILRAFQPHQTVSLAIQRAGQPLNLTALLAARR
jgi:membrane-associated protease RseP (regulator of RpoE activity)